jgi:glycosyltransferase involved in cell wall biosynthesis
MPAADRAFYALRSHAAPADARPPHGPLVSCVMPTRNRRPWVAQAIAYFARQDYPDRELLVLDDGEDRVADLIPDDPRIRYVALDGPLILGEKRNCACELARGEIIAHWDDDDWQSPTRLSYQVRELERHGADLCGPGRAIFFDPAAARAWQYEYPQAQRPWIAGNAMCYRRQLWAENPFAPMRVGEDTQFIWNPRVGRPLVLDEHRFFAALVHPDNTSRKLTNGCYWRPHPLEDVRALLGDDYGFYERRAHATDVAPAAGSPLAPVWLGAAH